VHSPDPLFSSEILSVKSIARLYKKMNEKQKLEKNLSIWGDAIVWSDLHGIDKTFVN
jgi:transposase